MKPGILTRIRRLEFSDRLLLLLTGVWTIVAIPGNYLRVRGLTNTAWLACILLVMLLWAAIAGVVAHSLVRQHRRLAAYGFSFSRGGLVSLAILALSHAYLVASGKFVLSATPYLPWVVLGVVFEELAFRAIAIDRFVLLMEGTKNRAFWAILLSSALWSIPHIPSKSVSQLVGGIFVGGLFFGYVYYKTRSILLPAWIHGLANAGYLGGLLIAALYFLLAVADWMTASRMKLNSQIAVASTNT